MWSFRMAGSPTRMVVSLFIMRLPIRVCMWRRVPSKSYWTTLSIHPPMNIIRPDPSAHYKRSSTTTKRISDTSRHNPDKIWTFWCRFGRRKIYSDMRIVSRAALLLILFTAVTSMITKKTTRVVFFGDSITEAGAQPGGYIVRTKEALEKTGRGGDYDLIGAGIGGNKVYDLYLRMDDDVLAQKPDVVVIWIGVNDVWHKSSM